MTWLAFAFALQAGLVPSNNFIMFQYEPDAVYESRYTDTGPIYFTDLQTELILFEPFSLFFGGGVRFQMTITGGSFNPQSIFYQFWAGTRYKGIELYYLRACRHPQMVYSWQYTVKSGWEGAYDEIGVKLSGKVNLIKTSKKRSLQHLPE